MSMNPIDIEAHKRAAQFVEPPDAVLILITEIERLRAENERLESELDVALARVKELEVMRAAFLESAVEERVAARVKELINP